MFEELYREAYAQLNGDMRRLVEKLAADNAGKSRAYRDGLTEACEAFLQLSSDSSGALIVALDREAEKEASYYGSVVTAEESAHEKP